MAATSGKLTVTIVEARMNVDLNTFSEMSPYVLIEMRMERHQTEVAEKGGMEPVFNKDIVFDVKYIGDDFTMRLMTKNAVMSDELMGESVIKLSALCHPNFDEWFEVTKDGDKTGSIHFKSVWEPFVDHSQDAALAQKEIELQNMNAMNQQMEN